jgi:excisionase family DNA binding protein
MTTDLADLLTIDDLVKRYDLSYDTVQTWLARGELRGAKLGKRWFVRAEDWLDFVDRRASHHHGAESEADDQ